FPANPDTIQGMPCTEWNYSCREETASSESAAIRPDADVGEPPGRRCPRLGEPAEQIAQPNGRGFRQDRAAAQPDRAEADAGVTFQLEAGRLHLGLELAVIDRSADLARRRRQSAECELHEPGRVP